MRRTCCSRTAGSRSLPSDRQVEQFIVRNAAPQEERQARSEFDVGNAIGRRPERLFAGSASMRNRKSGLTSTRSSAARMPASKFPPRGLFCRNRAVSRRRHRSRAGDSPPRQTRQNLRRAGRSSSLLAGRQTKRQPPARRILRHLAVDMGRQSAATKGRAAPWECRIRGSKRECDPGPRLSGSASSAFRMVATTCRSPAFTGTRTCSASSANIAEGLSR